MNKLNKLFAILFAVLGVNALSAQTWADITNGDGNTFTKQYAAPSNHDVFETWTGTASTTHAFDWNQTVTNIPDGVYELSTNAMYRASLTYGTPTNCVLYATVGEKEYTTPIANFADYTANEDRGQIATQMQNNDAYKSKIGNIIVENGEAKIGIKSIGELAHCTNGYWFVCKKSTFAFKNVTDTYFAGLQEKINRMLTYATESDAKTELNTALATYVTATVENIKGLQAAIAEFMRTASTTNPVDVTPYMANPSFEGSFTTYWYQDLGYTQNSNRDIQQPAGWNLMYSSAKVGNTQYQSFKPQTDGAKDGNCLYVRHRWGDVYAIENLRQSVQELPAGQYKLVVSVKGGSSVTDANTLTLSAGNNTSTTTISDFDKTNYKDYNTVVIKVSDDESLDICYGFKQTSGVEQLYYIDDFRLYYLGDPIAPLLEEIASKKTVLEGYDGKIPFTAYARYTDHITAAENADNTKTIDELQAIVDNLNGDIADAEKLALAYASLKTLITQCETYVAEDYSIVKTDDVRTTFSSAITKAETNVEEKTTADDVNAVYATLEAARQAYIVAAIPTAGNSFDMTFKMTNPQVTSASGWANGGTATNQQYTGAPDNTYLDFYQVTRDMYQTLSGLPNGSYSIKAATRGHASVSVGYIYVKNGDNKITQDIHKVGNSGNDLGNGWGWTTTNSVSVVDGQLTIGFYGECGSGQWVGADNFTLYRTFDVTGVQAGLTDLKSEAQAIATASEPMDAAVEAALNSTIQATDDTATDPVTLDNMAAALSTAIANAEASIADYEKILSYITKANGIDASIATDYRTQYENGTIAETVEAVFQNLEVATYNYVTSNFTYQVALSDTWNSTGTNTSAATYDTEHWSGEKREYKNQFDSWGDPKQGFAANSWSIDFNQDVTLPAGEYVFKVAGRKSPDATLELVVTMGETILGTVNDFPSTNDALGINKAGETSFDANDPAGFAKDGKGWGWQWRYVKFELEEEAVVKVAIHAETSKASNWVSFGDYTLQMTEDTYLEANKGGLDAPTAAAEALVNTKPMGNAENEALEAALAMTYTTGAGLQEKINALNAAVANANAWLAAYNEAKAPLVAALERFETDYNDAENGALDYMNKSRWATAIEKAQAAAVAKDATDSYAGFADATAALVDALDAATVSVNEYASLKSAITEAAAVSESEVNWGDAPFQRPESAREGLNTAISAAESGYNAAEADGEEVTALVDAMAVTLNAPQDAYCITVATGGHAYVDCPVVASSGSITDNNPTGYGLAAKEENEDLLAQLYTFTRVEGNNYRISVTVDGETVYLTYGVLNGSQAGHRNWQIQGNTDIAKAGEFEVVASTTTEGVFRLRNTVTGTFLDCQDGGAIYTDDNITKDEFALTSATGSADINISADAKLGTCVLMFDAQLPDGLTAYVPESYDNETTVLTLKMVTGGVLPAYTPCLLYAEGGYEGTLTGTVTMNGYAGKVTGDDGLLYGAIEPQEITEGYILQKHDGQEVAKFYSVDGLEEEIPISAGKCWLTLANGVEEALETPAAVAFFFRGGGATKLNAVVMDKTSLDGAIYTLDGKRVNTMQRGEIYIINGQKVMVK